jgi:endonuclease/exonuclease/phosphatase family metal-dependent hydrolase
MNVVTLNLWARQGDWPARREVLVSGLRALAPDLVALQETIVTEDSDQARDILGDGFHVVHSRRRDPEGLGISIASRWPFAAVEELQLEGSVRDEGFPCTTLIATVEVPGIEAGVRFANHFPSWKPQQEFERERQAVQAARRLEELPGHAIVAGDFDADPDAASLRFWMGRQSLERFSVCYRDAWARVHPSDDGAATFSPNENPLVVDPDWPFQRIDHILVRCGEHGGPTLPIRGCRRIFDDVPASDHYGLLAELE